MAGVQWDWATYLLLALTRGLGAVVRLYGAGLPFWLDDAYKYWSKHGMMANRLTILHYAACMNPAHYPDQAQSLRGMPHGSVRLNDDEDRDGERKYIVCPRCGRWIDVTEHRVLICPCGKWLTDVSELALAGAGGFEPPNGGTKSRCLTTWRRPINAGALIVGKGAVGSLDVLKMLRYRRAVTRGAV